MLDCPTAQSKVFSNPAGSAYGKGRQLLLWINTALGADGNGLLGECGIKETTAGH